MWTWLMHVCLLCMQESARAALKMKDCQMTDRTTQTEHTGAEVRCSQTSYRVALSDWNTNTASHTSFSATFCTTKQSPVLIHSSFLLCCGWAFLNFSFSKLFQVWELFLSPKTCFAAYYSPLSPLPILSSKSRSAQKEFCFVPTQCPQLTWPPWLC